MASLGHLNNYYLTIKKPIVLVKIRSFLSHLRIFVKFLIF